LPRLALVWAALAAGLASAQDVQRPIALHVAWEPAWSAGAPIILPVASEPSRATVELPAMDRAQGQRVCLRFQARLHTATPAGWNNYLGLLLNGQAVDRRGPDGWPRSVSRPPVFPTAHPNYPEVELVQLRASLPCLQVFFGPPDADLTQELLEEGAEGYWYLLDVDDLLDAEGPNRLDLANTALAEYWGGRLPPGLEMIVSDLALGRVPEGEVRRLQGEGLSAPEPYAGPPALTSPAGTVRLTPAGGLQIEARKQTWFIESAFSYPAEPAMGFHRLRCRREPGAEWQSTIDRRGPALRFQADGATYRLLREVRWQRERLEVTDTLTNLTDEVQGVAVEHSLLLEQPPESVKLNGVDAIAHGAGSCPENPTLFAARGQAGLGLVAEDDAMRLQMSTRALVNGARLRTDRLGLAPRETYALHWAVYTGPADYWAFLNRLRRDWDVNYTVEGPFDFFDVRPLATEEGRAAARALLARKPLKLFALVPWFEYYNGWGYTRDEYRDMMTRAMAFIREVVPDAKCLACTETNLVPVPLTFFGDTLPRENWPIGRQNGGQYGQPATPGMTACVDASEWRDSCIRQADGNVVLDCWYVQHYLDPPALNLMVYPELGNHRHSHMLEQLGWLLDDVGFDGIYIDQFSMAYSVGTDRFTRERWDGRTVTLDPTGRVQATLGDLGLISAPARGEWVQFILDRGKTVVCNSHPVVQRLQSLRTFRFMETQGYDPLTPADGPPVQEALAKGQLHSPVGLGHSFPNTAGADFFMRTLIAHLRFGILYYCYSTDLPPDGERGGEYGPLRHMFPFTPVELHEGWVLGQERLLTCLSGMYVWPHAERPRVLLFDSRGRERPSDAVVERHGETWRVSVTLKDWWEVAVILPPGA
jgi:hypothetical protein